MTTTIEKKTIKKTMFRILPFILILYVIAYLDRVNLGFAALEMNADLALTAEAFGLLSGIFFIGYFFFEVPSNMIMHKVGARLWITRIMLSWGIIVILTGFVQTPTQLYIVRFLLGVAEAGFFPGVILYLTYWFREKERGKATAILLLALPIGGLIGSPLSAWIIDNISWGSLEGWRWMFILEGIPALILGVITIFYLTDRPKKAKWLNTDEQNWLENELKKEREKSLELNKPSKLQMLKDITVWKLAAFYFAAYTGIYGLSFWVPTIIKSLSETGSTNMQVGWLAMLPSLIGIPAILFVGYNTDRTGKHKLHLLICLLIAAIGFFGCGVVSSLAGMVTMLSLASAGLYGFTGSFFAYLTFFFTESTAPVGIALVNSFAALGGFVGPTILGFFTLKYGMFLLCTILFVGIFLLLTMKKTNIEIAAQNKKIILKTNFTKNI